jgi:hypothetical protein
MVVRLRRCSRLGIYIDFGTLNRPPMEYAVRVAVLPVRYLSPASDNSGLFTCGASCFWVVSPWRKTTSRLHDASEHSGHCNLVGSPGISS